MSGCVSVVEFFCDGRCRSRDSIRFCDGRRDCFDGADEMLCQSKSITDEDYFVPSSDVVTSIVLPTIFACIFMVAAMLLGIQKCKQWDVDRIMEMRRTRRVVQRVTARLREKNFRTIQRARNMRKRAMQQRGASTAGAEHSGTTTATARTGTATGTGAPPLYDAGPPFTSGASPPPAYEDALLDEFFLECFPPACTSRSQRSSTSSRRSLFSAPSSHGIYGH
uniref:Uncharacterized protein n=1 Tax=Plectus sambesii TaxID=2011161 RepID=A0A914X0Y5_9BILA